MQQIDKKQLFMTSGRHTGRLVYMSYNTPIALIDGKKIITSGMKYSMTTSRHKNYIIRDLHQGSQVVEVPHKVFKQIMTDESINLGWA